VPEGNFYMIIDNIKKNIVQATENIIFSEQIIQPNLIELLITYIIFFLILGCIIIAGRSLIKRKRKSTILKNKKI